MKHAILAVTILFSLSGPLSVLAEEQAALEEPTESVTSVTEASNSVNPDMPRPMHGKGHGGMKHGGGQHGKGHGGMKHGCGQHGKGHGGMKRGGGQHGKGHDEKHAQVVRRLDMIEVRLAKIEAMIEILMRR
jgi:hypothetical protein